MLESMECLNRAVGSALWPEQTVPYVHACRDRLKAAIGRGR